MNSEKDLESYCLYKRNVDRLLRLIGTVFKNFSPDLKQLPISLDYKIRYGIRGFADTFNNELRYRVKGPNKETSKYKNIYWTVNPEIALCNLDIYGKYIVEPVKKKV